MPLSWRLSPVVAVRHSYFAFEYRNRRDLLTAIDIEFGAHRLNHRWSGMHAEGTGGVARHLEQGFSGKQLDIAPSVEKWTLTCDGYSTGSMSHP